MDLPHLRAIGLVDFGAECSEFESFFSAGPEKTYLQFVFGCPLRPRSVLTLAGYIDYLEECLQRWPVALAKGGPEFPAQALRLASERCGGSAVGVSNLLKIASKRVLTVLAETRLCDSLMRQDGLWDIASLQERFLPGVVPSALLKSSSYSSYSWVKKHPGRTFISIDMSEANLTSMALMAQFVDPELSSLIKQGWQRFLNGVLGDDAAAVGSVRQFRQVLLGTVEREWLRIQRRKGQLKHVIGEPALARTSTDILCELVGKKVDPKTHHLTDEEAQACIRARSRFRTRISAACRSAQKVVIRWVAGVINDKMGLQVFAVAGSDEAVFLLPQECQHSELVDEAMKKCSQTLSDAVHREHKELVCRFRFEAFRPIDISSAMSAHGCPQATIVLTRRLHAKSFVQLKCLPHEMDDQALNALEGTFANAQRCHSEAWVDWMS